MTLCRPLWPWAVLIGVSLTACTTPAGKAVGQEMQPELPSYKAIYRIPVPEKLPEHPRVFCTADDLARIRADMEAGDEYTTICVNRILSQAESYGSGPVEFNSKKPWRADFHRAATLAQAYALSDNEVFGQGAKDLLLAFADICPGLETTRERGRFTGSTLREGGLAVDAAMAYDLIANAPFLTDADRLHIEQDLLRILGWECGHRCGHTNSSNWRTWALAILASCGFAIGDHELIDEAVNGVYDPDRKVYLYGMVQQLTHSIFADGIHWERSMGYTYYTASALVYIMVAAKNSGIDLWHAELPGLLGPFEGSARHEEYGPAGNRSLKAFLDGPFYYAFPGGSLAQVGDSSTGSVRYHQIYELAYKEYEDPKYAWLINRERQGAGDVPTGWSLWRARGNPQAGPLLNGGRGGKVAFRLQTDSDDRIALVQDVRVPADAKLQVSGWVKALGMQGASAHIRCNSGESTVFTNRVREVGDWRQVRAQIPPEQGATEGKSRSVRLHLFLEDGAGEVLWDDIVVTVGASERNIALNGSFENGRGYTFWDLVHSPKEVPAGHYSLQDDAQIGINGRHVNGCTLFPVGGFALLRADATDVDATAINFTFGPYGSGHDHPDRLHFDLYALGEVLCPDAGSWGYDNPMHLTWANQTIAHNTLTVDQVSQYPQGTSDSIWARERGEKRVFGQLRMFHHGTHLKAVRATCDTAYEGVTLDRTLCLVDNYVLDVFRVASSQQHTYDLALHGRGQVTTDAALVGADENPFTARGYRHLTDVRRGSPPAGLFRAVFSDGQRSVRMLQMHPQDGEIILGKDPKENHDTSVCIQRRQCQDTVYVSVLEPYIEGPTVRSLSGQEQDGALVISVEHTTGRDSFTVPASKDEAVILTRFDERGIRRVEEVAEMTF